MKTSHIYQAQTGLRLGSLISAVRTATRTGASWAETADLVADVLRLHRPGSEILTAEQLYGDPAGYRCHLLHAEPDGAFSVVALAGGLARRRRSTITSPGASSASSRAPSTKNGMSCATVGSKSPGRR